MVYDAAVADVSIVTHLSCRRLAKLVEALDSTDEFAA